MKKKPKVEIMQPNSTTNSGGYAVVHYHYQASTEDRLRKADKILIALFGFATVFNIVTYFVGR